MPSDRDGKVWVEVSGDEMTAAVFITPPMPGHQEVDVLAVKRAAAEAGVVSGLVNNEKIAAFVEEGKINPVDFIIAVGTPPGHGTDASMELMWMKDASGGEGSGGNVNLRELNLVKSVGEGEVIARRVPPTRGTEGATVTGNKVPGEWGSDIMLKAGANVEVSADGSEYKAAIGGSPKFAGGVVSVDPVYVIRGDVDYNIGNVNFAGALEIHGSVADGFIVKAEGNITIGGNVQACEIVGGGDIVVKGGIITRREGMVSARGSVSAKFIENSIVEADGDVLADRAIINSVVRSNGSVVCTSREGRIMGGDVMAYNEIKAKHLGTERETATLLRAGFKFETYLEMADIEQKMEKANFEIERIKKSLASAGAASKTETVDNLRAALSQLESGRTGLSQRLAALRNRFQVNPFAAVKGEEFIHPGCMIYIGGAREKTSRALRYATLSADREGGLALSSYDERTGSMKTTNVGTKEKKKTVMIVDDAKFMRTKLRNIIENAGVFRIIGEAEDGAQAVAMYGKLTPDVITMDITMPNLDGIAALREIRKQKNDARVIMISALGQKEKVKDSLIAGASDFIIKPFVPERVVEVLTRIANK